MLLVTSRHLCERQKRDKRKECGFTYITKKGKGALEIKVQYGLVEVENLELTRERERERTSERARERERERET